MQNDEQLTLERFDAEIQAELATAASLPDEPNAADEPNTTYEPNTAAENQTNEGAQRASRKPYRITDFDSPRDKEMAVFTHAKKLSEYIFVITEKSPKKLRWSIVSRLINESVTLVENLYKANFERDDAARLQHQRTAMVNLRLIDFYTETARKKQAITIHQTAVLAQQIGETDKLLNGWIRSTKKK